MLAIEYYCITASVSHLTCFCHHISQSFDLPTATVSVSHLTCPLPPCYCVTALPHQSVIWLTPCYHTSQSFDLPTATTSVSHLTCPLPLHHCITTSLCYCVTTSVSHLTCPRPLHQSVIWLVHCHHISQSFDMPSTIASLHYHITVLLCHYISQSFDLPPTTTSVSHLTCSLPPHQSVIWHALYHCITTLPHHCVTALVSHLPAPCHHISESFDLPIATTSSSHLTCPIPLHHFSIILSSLVLVLDLALVTWLSHCPPHQWVIWLATCHHISQSFDLPSSTASPHYSVTM